MTLIQQVTEEMLCQVYYISVSSSYDHAMSLISVVRLSITVATKKYLKVKDRAGPELVGGRFLMVVFEVLSYKNEPRDYIETAVETMDVV